MALAGLPTGVVLTPAASGTVNGDGRWLRGPLGLPAAKPRQRSG